jgi:FlaA1/EpsC-like NDP-sugar epimerase
VLLSTDKAVQPASVMGATKRVAEHIVLQAGGVILRLGNVLASSDSVTEIFARQIAHGGPLTVTEPAARRYFLSMDEAVDSLFIAGAQPETAVLWAPRLEAEHYITDLAHFMAGALAQGRKIPIEFTGPRPGDKEAERLWSATESVETSADAMLVKIATSRLIPDLLHGSLDRLRGALVDRDTAAALRELCRLVPDYTPSAIATGMMTGLRSQVSP